MPETIATSVQKLQLDLANFRTVPQKNEEQAIQAMISISPDRFWALTESLLDDGFLPTENIIVLKSKTKGGSLTVKEGNRRVAALKLIHGVVPIDNLNVPDEIQERIAANSAKWKRDNKNVPCTIYPPEDAELVDKIVTLTHGKGEKASREHWNAVARARHNRDHNGQNEIALDLLEQYLAKASNHSKQQAERWGGDFPLTVLEEAIKKIAGRFGAANAPDLVKRYPKISHRTALDDIIKAIGSDLIGFKHIRGADDFLIPFGVPPIAPANAGPTAGSGATGNGSTSGGNSNTGGGKGSATSKPKASAINDPKTVMNALKKFTPRGNGREKVVSLLDELKNLKLEKNPLAFCFLLRSMFEISAKAYCADHSSTGGPTLKKSSGEDKSLVVILKDISNHLTGNQSDREKTKLLHGALTELARPEGILSVTSMNQLVHNPNFSVTPGDIASLFGKTFPLLTEMNL